MKLPLLPTAIVAAAVAVMIGLGVWQLGRAKEKDALAARYEQNMKLAPLALPTMGPLDESLLFRRATAFCLEVTGWRKAGGKAASGKTGTRHIADCRTGVEGPGFAVDAGLSPDPRKQPVWRGGEVTGRIVPEPSSAGIWQRLWGKGAPPRPMIVAEQAAAGLEPSAPPSAASITNNSLSYALQWFFFAAAAAAIYGLALRRRQREKLPPAA